MSSFKIFDVAGSGMSAQSVRLNTVASNLANADSVSGDPNTVYKARHPVFEAVKKPAAMHLSSPGGFGISPSDQASGAAVRVNSIVESTAPADRALRPRQSARRRARQCLRAERQRHRRDDRHDLGLARLSGQRGGHEHLQGPDARHPEARPVTDPATEDR